MQRITDTSNHHNPLERSFRNVEKEKEGNWNDDELKERLDAFGKDKMSQQIIDTVWDAVIYDNISEAIWKSEVIINLNHFEQNFMTSAIISWRWVKELDVF